MNSPNPSTPAARRDDGDAVVRDALEEDAHPIAVVHVRSFQSAYRRVLPSHILEGLDIAARTRIWMQRIADAGSDRRRVMVAELDGRVAAFTYFGPSPDDDDSSGTTGHVYSMHADPNLAGRGIGSMLMAHAVEEMALDAFTDASLWVVAENSRARRFYERLGWRADGVRRTELLGLPGEPGAEREAETIRYRLKIGPIE